jgi:hypothetical protein
MSHTPGPWKQDYFTASNGDKVHGVKSNSMSIAVAWVHGRNEDDAEGNARLIAAAPDLLQSLKWALARVEQCAPHQAAEGDAALYEIAAARSAIVKATGGAA